MKFLMIAVFWYGHGLTSQAAVFNSEALCENAKKVLISGVGGQRHREVYCLPFEEPR